MGELAFSPSHNHCLHVFILVCPASQTPHHTMAPTESVQTFGRKVRVCVNGFPGRDVS